MASLPRLSESIIKSYIPDPYFARGKNYYRNGQISDTIRRGNVIEGDCQGSEYEPYRVKATLGSKSVESSECSCPIGGGCKHVVALLLAWHYQSGAFEERQPVGDALEEKGREELIALVREMIKREPELEYLIDLPLAGGKGGKKGKPVEVKVYRRQIQRAMSEPYDWRGVRDAVQEISTVVDIGDQYAKAEDWANAQTIYQVVVDEVLKDYESVEDEGEIGSEVDRAIEGLGECLAARADDPAARRELLRALFNVIKWDTNAGGLGVGDGAEDLLFKHAANNDYAEIRKWVEAEVKAQSKGGDEFSSKWRRDRWGNFLSELDARDKTADPETSLKRAKALGLHPQVFVILLELKRYDEAVEVAKKHLATSAWERIGTADKLEAAKRFDEALALVEAGLPGNTDDRLFEWLAVRYKKQGNKERALELQLIRWQKGRPSEKLYDEIAALAKTMRQWESMRPKLLSDLKARKQNDVLASIYLREKEWDLALAVAQSDDNPWWTGQNLKLVVAQGVEKERPEEAIDLYLEAAEKVISQQGRENYKTAAGYLQRVRDLFTALDQKEEWAQTIAVVRERHKNKPALKEELNRAKL
jgi:uncharacterized Zn finger protein